MRSATALLPAALVCLVAACSSAPSASDDHADGGAGGPFGGGPSGKADAAPAPPPPTPPLSFTYDDAKGRLHARVKRDTPAGAVVYARTLRSDSVADDVDCTALARSAPAIALTGATPFDDTLDALGPTVSADLLPSIYGAQAKTRLSRSAIEGCLLDAKGAVLARVSMSLMAAWDAFAPVKVVDATTRLHGVRAYAEACESDLGDLSLFANGALDCVGGRDAQIVPITVSNPSSPDTVVTSLDSATTAFPLKGAQLAATTRCDRPAWLGYAGDRSSQCSPFSRIAASVNAMGTRIVVACRRYKLRAKDDTAFDDINLIAHNPTSGKTCFFNSRLETTQDASHVPSPSAEGADRFWMDVRDVASVGCASCHDADPWIHSPWIDQLKGKDGHALVPKIGEDNAYSKATKYSIFARESLTVPSRTRDGDVAWEQPSMLVDAGTCGSCHRIGSQASLAEWVARSVGDGSAASWINTWVSDAYRTTAKLKWMSPNGAGNATSDAASVRAILACGNRGASCATTPTPH